MKTPLQDRIDVLMEKARSGNSRAQLKLAHCFYEGKFVEKSYENALYWAFKASLSSKSLVRSDAECYFNIIKTVGKL